MLVDSHIHTKENSDDASLSLFELISYVLEKPDVILCTTEHYDYDYPIKEAQLIFDPVSYFDLYIKTKNTFEDTNQRSFPVLFGVEYGYLEHLGEYFNSFSLKYPFDSIICSTHYVLGCDPFFDRSIYEKNQQDVYDSYLEMIIHSLINCSEFDIVGHFDYISRYASYTDRKMYYRNHSDRFDEIFRLCIENGKSLELNTRTSAIFRGENRNDYLFDVDILKRYKEMGGELVSFGSDAHSLNNILVLYDETKGLLKSTGFDKITYFKERKPIMISI